MKILFVRAQNPFYESSADANRFSGLLKGLMSREVEVTILVTKGYNNLLEFKQKGLPDGMKNLKVKYTVTVFNTNILFRRINTIVLGAPIASINKKYLCKYLK